MDLARRKELYKRCDPFEALSPDDPRYVDVDAAAGAVRGGSVVDALAARLEIADGPEVAFFTGLPGSGKSTELRRLAHRLSDPTRGNAFVVRVNAEDWMDLASPVDVVDLLLMLISETEWAVARACGRALYQERISSLFMYQVTSDVLFHAAKRSSLWDLATTLKADPSAWANLREAASRDFGSLLRDIGERFKSLSEEVTTTLGQSDIVLIVDSLEKLRRHGLDGADVLGSLERALRAFRAISEHRPGPVVFMLPPALALRMRLDNLGFLPMIRLRDQASSSTSAGMEACRALVRARLSAEDLSALFGDGEEARAVDRIVEASGGAPREIVRLLRSLLAVSPEDGPIASAAFDREIDDWKEAYRRAVPTQAMEWLGRVSRGKRLFLAEERDQAIAEQALSNGLVVQYRNGSGWFDVHPAIEDMVRAEEPSPAQPDTDPPRSPPRSPDPHALTRLALTHVGPFAELSIELRPGWNVLLGDNGCGKTSVLRAIALALAGTDPRAAVASQRQLRAGETHGSVTITTDRGTYTTSIQRLPAEVRTTANADTLTQQGRWLTLGFPAVRGLTAKAISGPTTVAPPVAGAHDLLPLLEGAADSRLDDSRQWIVNTALRADSNEAPEIRERHGRLLARWFEILHELMPGLSFRYDRVDRDSWQVFVKTADGTIPIEQLSQGMVSTIGWIGTLLRRLYEAFPDSPEPENEPALVLVDEIDAHLHPTWQRRVVPLVRARFPRVQVIATTHSPLIVSNLQPDEIVLFRRDAEGRLVAERITEPLRGYRADQVLTSGAFGLDTTRSEYATALLRDYEAALSEGAETPEAKARLADLTARVRREIPSPPETIEERAALDEAIREADEAVQARLDAASPEELERLEALVRAHRSPGSAR